MTAVATKPDLQPIRHLFAEALSEQQLLAESVEQALTQLDGLRTKLDGWQEQLHREFAELERQKASFAQPEEPGEQDRSAHAAWEQLREECDQLHAALEAKESEIQALRTMAEAANSAELASELEDARQLAAQAAGTSSEEIQALEQERTALESELEIVRNRAAELSDTLSQERRQMSEDRAEWANELKQLRRLMERQTAVSVASAAAQPDPDARKEEPPVAASSPSRVDPVVGSVLAQFDKIRQQRAAQRAKRK